VHHREGRPTDPFPSIMNETRPVFCCFFRKCLKSQSNPFFRAGGRLSCRRCSRTQYLIFSFRVVERPRGVTGSGKRKPSLRVDPDLVLVTCIPSRWPVRLRYLASPALALPQNPIPRPTMQRFCRCARTGISAPRRENRAFLWPAWFPSEPCDDFFFLSRGRATNKNRLLARCAFGPGFPAKLSTA